jgi:four helix bundle protein
VATRQFVAAATSVRANIAEGHGRYSRAAYRNHLSIARGSTAETMDWIDLLRSIDLLSAGEERQLAQRCQRIMAALTSAMQKLSTSTPGSASRVRETTPPYGSDTPFDIDLHDEGFDDDALMLPSSHALEGNEHDVN